MKKYVIIISCAVGAGFWLSHVSTAADQPAAGKTIYESKCAGCHAKDGKGNPAMEKMFKLEPGTLSLVGKSAAGMSEADEIALVKKGKGKMPAFGTLPEKDIVEAVKYEKSLGGGAVKKTEAAPAAPAVPAGSGAAVDLAKSAGLYTAKCASCHGADGKGKEPMAKMFKVEMALLDLVDADTQGKTDAALDDVTAKGLGKMPAYAGKISEGDIKGLTTYLRKLAGK